MKLFLLLITLTLASFSMLTATAEAKRMGGGGNIGKQRTISPQQAKAPTTTPASTTPATPAAGNKWLGPLAGLAIGAGLGAMFAGGMGGLGGAMGGILMALLAAGLVMFLVSRFRKSQVQQPAMQYTGSGTSSYQPASRQQPFAGAGGNTSPPAPQTSSNIPADFPVEAFLRSAKTSFIRLQAANDRKDVNDIREYTTPEMFAEISLQLQERGDAQQKTDVQTINTQIIEVINEGDYAIASVRMSGQLSENNGIPESFNEIWHVQKNLRDEKAVWLLSGIQQVA
ncbi:MAG: TIM44-like domain-containing protein [Candidatus Nitrotoga sp.]